MLQSKSKMWLAKTLIFAILSLALAKTLEKDELDKLLEKDQEEFDKITQTFEKSIQSRKNYSPLDFSQQAEVALHATTKLYTLIEWEAVTDLTNEANEERKLQFKVCFEHFSSSRVKNLSILFRKISMNLS